MLQMEKFYSSFFSEIIRKYLQVIANRNPAVTISVNKWAFSKQYIRSFHSFLWLSSICVCVCVCVYKYSRTLTWWLSGEESTCQCRYMGLIPGSGRSHGEGNGNPLWYFLPGKSHEQRRLVVYSPWGHKGVGHNLWTEKQQQQFTTEPCSMLWLLFLCCKTFCLVGPVNTLCAYH